MSYSGPIQVQHSRTPLLSNVGTVGHYKSKQFCHTWQGTPTGLTINGNNNIAIIDLTAAKRPGLYIIIQKQPPPMAAMQLKRALQEQVLHRKIWTMSIASKVALKGSKNLFTEKVFHWMMPSAASCAVCNKRPCRC
jgi:hypothetical protein